MTINKDKNILIVEENSDFQRCIKNLLEEDLVVSITEDNATTWERICRQMPDLVVSEVIIVKREALQLIKKNLEGVLSENKLNDKFLKKAGEVVRANVSNQDFDKNKFASAMHVSSSLLYKKIKALTSHTPIDYIKSIRMNYAIELLQTKKYTVTEVSELCGFSSLGYFSMVFKKYYGKQPSEFL